ncbi:hypothetical protein TWF718_002706 [Orbilia javanica]|uniref:Uncharacterized protein n=1 Tax=Orbilia javanica TaxID=47235 RepID=A0AAN8MQT3_9PEZI
MCLRILIEREKTKTVTIKDDRDKKKEEPKKEEPKPEAPALTDVYYDPNTGKFYSKTGPPTDIKLQSMKETTLLGQPVVQEEISSKKVKKTKKSKEKEEEPSSAGKCRHKEKKALPHANCCDHKEYHRSGCKRSRQNLLLEQKKVQDDTPIDSVENSPRIFKQVNMRRMERPDGRGYKTKELAIEAAHKQGLVVTHSKQAIQVMPGKRGGYFVVGITDP